MLSSITAALATAWAKVQGYLLIVAGAVTGIAVIALQVFRHRATVQAHKADQARRELEAVDARRTAERKVTQAQAEARNENAEAERVRNATPKTERRRGRLSGLDRVRMHETDD